MPGNTNIQALANLGKEGKIDGMSAESLKNNYGIEDDTDISYIAEISKRKRQEYLIKALKKYPFTNEKFLLVGDQTNSKKIRKW